MSKKITVIEGGRSTTREVADAPSEQKPKTIGFPAIILQDHMGNKQMQSYQRKTDGSAEVVSVASANANQVWADFWPKYLAWDSAKVIAELENARDVMTTLGAKEDRSEAEEAVLKAAVMLVNQYDAKQIKESTDG